MPASTTPHERHGDGGPTARRRRPRLRRLAVVAVVAPLVLVLVGCDPQISTLTRPIDPVVVTGAQVPGLQGAVPGQLVGFRWVLDVGWQQVPVQVDEKKNVDLGVAYHKAANGVVVPAYADAGTWVGADADATFDADDELAFMARDAGGLPPEFSEPPGVERFSGVDIRVTDPTVADVVGHLYVFRSTTLSPGAGQQYVSYSFSLTSGDYKTTYKYDDGPNPENTRITTAAYQRHFTDRWAEDELKITTAGATGVDILDRHKVRFGPGICQRSEDTFDDAEGAFLTNRAGPVRAIRSYIGANSGPNTVRTHVFYDRREDVITDLRVHAIPAIMDFYDYSPAATGMTYANPSNAALTIDGIPDAATAGAIPWEKVDGAPGAVVMSNQIATNLPLTPTAWWEDNKTNPTAQCTGDAAAYGSSGPYINTQIACTDPQASAGSCTNTLRGLRSLSYLPPGVSNADAATRAQQMATPLAVTSGDWRPKPPTPMSSPSPTFATGSGAAATP
jgi:hypothetical protein